MALKSWKTLSLSQECPVFFKPAVGRRPARRHCIVKRLWQFQCFNYFLLKNLFLSGPFSTVKCLVIVYFGLWFNSIHFIIYFSGIIQNHKLTEKWRLVVFMGGNPKKSRVKLDHLNKSKELPKTWKRNFRISKLIDQHYFNVFDEKLRC